MPIDPVKYWRVYLNYSEIFGGTVTEQALIDEIKTFRRQDLLIQLSIVGFILHNERWDNQEVQRFLAAIFFAADTLKKIDGAAQKVARGGRLASPPAIFLEWQIESLAKLAILHTCDETGSSISSEEERFRLGKCCLMMNDLLRRPAPNLEETNRGEVRKALLEEVIRSGLLHANEHFQYSFVRTYELFSSIAGEMSGHPQYYDIHAAFQSATGYSVKEYLALGLSIWSWWFDIKRDTVSKSEQIVINPTTVFKNTDGDPRKYETFFDQVSLDTDAYRTMLEEERAGLRNNWEFWTSNVTLEKLPIVRNGHILICLSMKFLHRKLTQQLFYTVNNSIVDKSERDRFREFFGRVFEEYVRRLLKRCLETRCRIDYYGASRAEAGDAVLIYPRALIIVEAKSSRLSLECVRSGNLESYCEALERVLVAGCKQIDQVITAFREGKYKIAGTNPQEIGRYYPIIVTAQHLPQETMTLVEMNRLIANENLFSEKDIAPPTLIDIGELEHLEPLLNAVSLVEILGKKTGSDIARAIPMKNFLIAEYGKLPRNETLMKRFDELFLYLQRLLFPIQTTRMEQEP